MVGALGIPHEDKSRIGLVRVLHPTGKFRQWDFPCGRPDSLCIHAIRLALAGAVMSK